MIGVLKGDTWGLDYSSNVQEKIGFSRIVSNSY